MISPLRFSPILALGLWAILSVTFSQPTSALTIVHSNDVMGELEPCGCRNNPLGGLARKSNLMKRNEDKDLIQLDAGDLLFATNTIPDALKNQSTLQAQYLLKASDLAHLDAVVPGEKEFALGLSTFQKLTKNTKVRFIAANLKAKNGKKLFEPHLLIKRKDAAGKIITVAVIGLVGENLSWPKELKATSAITAARAQVQELRSKADYVIALTHQGAEKDEALAKAVPGIDIIIGAHSQAFFQTPVQVGRTQIYQSSFRNQYVGLIPLSKSMKAEDYKLIALDPAYDSPAQAPSEMDDLVKEFKKAIADLNAREEASLTSMAVPASSHDKKFQTFARCAECHLKQFEFWRKTPHARALDTLVKAGQAQNKECLSCHSVGLGDPQGFEFVTRLAELKGEDDKISPMPLDDLHSFLKSMTEASSLDSEVKLSTSGKPLPLRQALSGISRSFTPVQCENCHSPGREHPFSSSYSKKVDTAETCLKCHTPERAPEWYKGNQPDQKTIEAKRAKMTCPAGELTIE